LNRLDFHIFMRKLSGYLMIFVSIAMSISLGGCFSFQEYPADWPQINDPNDIEIKIVGTFSCLESAQEVRGESSNAYLSEILGREFRCNRVYIQRISDRLIFRYIDNDSRFLGEQIFIKNEDYKVEDGWIKFESIFESIGEGGVGLYVLTMPQLTIDNTDDLVIKRKTTAGGIVLLIPVMGMGTSWHKFDRINGNSAETEHSILTGRAATQAASSNLVSASAMLSMPDKEVCRKAIIKASDVIIWDTSYSYARYSKEAKRRGLTLEQCAILAGRTTTQ
jgi:hypothetical protein